VRDSGDCGVEEGVSVNGDSRVEDAAASEEELVRDSYDMVGIGHWTVDGRLAASFGSRESQREVHSRRPPALGETGPQSKRAEAGRSSQGRRIGTRLLVTLRDMSFEQGRLFCQRGGRLSRAQQWERE
jgi:hypothetical protein